MNGHLSILTTTAYAHVDKLQMGESDSYLNSLLFMQNLYAFPWI